MPRLVEVTELALRDGHQSLMATRMATGRHGPRLRGHRPGRLLERRVLGRGHLRLLHPLPQRRPLGAAAHLPQADAQLPAADAAARAEPAGLPPLRGHGRRPLRGQVGRERHGRLPRLRRAQRHPQPPPRARGRPPHRQARRRARSATPSRPLHTVEQFVEMAPAAQGPGLRLDLHQGHGRAAQAAAGLRHRPGHQGEACGEDTLRPRPRPRDHGRHAGQPDEGDRGGRRHRGHVDLVAQPGPGPQPDRGPGRDARGHRATRPGWTRSGCSRSRSTSPRSARATRSSSRSSSASRPRSSTARSPAA